MINPIDRIREVYLNNQGSKRIFLGKVDKNLFIDNLFLPNLKSGTVVEKKYINLYEDFRSIGKIESKILAIFSETKISTSSEVTFEGFFSVEEFLIDYGFGLTLDGIYFPGANLSNANLNGSTLRDSILIGVIIKNANLKNVDFSNANLQGANLEKSNMLGSTFQHTDLRRSNLRQCELRETLFKGASLRGAELWGAYLWGVKFDECFMDGLDISRADTRGSKHD
ncbi:hypothetical protein COK00_21830 [Bacillus cereus]|uniref:pentapeptide repeat-containing protein n=1 Tax=Bacillus cereus TaxID=1396 RepID=UPI000BEC2B44|nr:pentapeptide repeat-containing protein [Bacillus cereus]PEC87369.1 hypothetical protein CON28_00085 [Bacillus cereus]PEX40075.1 hypothetical protein CN455_04620 [Bacillus cereus]PFB16566.1 hypothetical protein CN399_11085 [Bacillus cereus]PFB67462.1 hypothetical protein CN291_10900 [Bacillus cereus]PFM38876.1 hypothetical protein COJ47_00515 [Bacillus cereus]